ncbi:leucine rich repeat protein [Leptospira weilii str. Ecochallenge]|uniref:Leucine rich repeat protein n=1 Tax=Leptospira weilii str. Ecochallenge TaxID=1049986 RepID=N1U6X5_9LEPT|nr:leucine rich repeat protein [Leptospira weilii str. Ecochallenge]
MQTLDLGDNQLTSIPKKIGQLQNLQRLNLWGNQLSSLPKGLLKKGSIKT